MDKKPFRVTNEQAKAVIACSDGGMECPSTCPNYGIDDCPIGNVADYMLAADLIDARDLIDKQEALIKEMRSMVEVIRDNSLNPAHTMTKIGLEETTDANRKLALSILEKTKDYE